MNAVTALLLATYISLGSMRILLIKLSENEDESYTYVPLTVNICVEFIKLCVTFMLAIRDLIADKRPVFMSLFFGNWKEFLSFMKWSVPGALYLADNLLMFFVIRSLQPAVAVVLGNFHIITTAVLFRVVIGRVLSRIQWTSLFILLLAIMMLSLQSQTNLHGHHHREHHHREHLAKLQILDINVTDELVNICHPIGRKVVITKDNGSSTVDPPGKCKLPDKWWTSYTFDLREGHFLVIVNCIISSTASVYNEKIFKEGDGLQDSIYLQTTRLYLFGSIFNCISLFTRSEYLLKLWKCGFFTGHNPYSIALIFVWSAYGLVVAFILKHRDNMFLVLAGQMQTVLTISLSIYFFGFRPDVNFFLMVPIVFSTIYIYHLSKREHYANTEVVVGSQPQLLEAVDQQP